VLADVSAMMRRLIATGGVRARRRSAMKTTAGTRSSIRATRSVAANGVASAKADLCHHVVPSSCENPNCVGASLNLGYLMSPKGT
jgi:hypothetical protein